MFQIKKEGSKATLSQMEGCAQTPAGKRRVLFRRCTALRNGSKVAGLLKLTD